MHLFVFIKDNSAVGEARTFRGSIMVWSRGG
ncbi:uncharacterized protein METZ01_LOCUS476639 [marine metagenome]|uniref:Uncharacterized protein n=1 Tax=marine metagenome TaxID=408172 RepID=A0A383BWY1_9ZZZZ